MGLNSIAAIRNAICRRVTFNILAERQGHVATISFGFDRDEEMAGPFLDPFNPQSRLSDVLLKMMPQILADPAYPARLEAHYHQVKGTTAAPTPDIQRVPARWSGGGLLKPARKTTPRRKNRSEENDKARNPCHRLISL